MENIIKACQEWNMIKGAALWFFITSSEYRKLFVCVIKQNKLQLAHTAYLNTANLKEEILGSVSNFVGFKC